MPRSADDPLLLTPGPVSVSMSTKQVMLRDRASGGDEFHADINLARDYMVALVGGQGAYTAIPLPGSATYANEAVISGLVPAGGKLLIHTNGVYGDRLIEICNHIGVACAAIRTQPFLPPTAEQFEAAIVADPAITHVFVVHCETSTGVVNPIEAIGEVCRRHSLGLFIDAVASFGAMPLDARQLGFQAVTVSSNKCMQGVPGIGWSVVQKTALENARGNCRPLVLDLWDQNQHMDRTNAFRFTPPTQVMAAFAQACREHAAEGGSAARLARYRANWRRLVDGMRQMGFVTVVPDEYAVADRCHLPQSRPSGVQLPGTVRGHEGARLHHLSRSAGARRYIPHRLHGRRHRAGHGRGDERGCRVHAGDGHHGPRARTTHRHRVKPTVPRTKSLHGAHSCQSAAQKAGHRAAK